MQYEVNQERCTGCGKCLDVCPPEAIKIRNGKAVILIECTGCGACPRVCPEGAIKKQGVKTPVAAIR